jgi:hypothetical protein
MVENIEALASGIGGVWNDISATSTITGWSSYTDKVIRYTQVGKSIKVAFAISGTSNAITVKFTVPVAAKNLGSGLTAEMATGLSIDNGALQTSQGRVYIDASVNASLVNIVRAGGTADWTASGTKLVRGVYIYEAA